MMAHTVPFEAESRRIRGGSIPGSGGAAAYELTSREPSAIPVLIAVPHAGRGYTATLLERMRDPQEAALRLEDRYVDRLARQLAARTGATLLVAHAPRAMIDLNRAPDDVDWDMIGGATHSDIGSYVPGRRARSGLGLIPRRLPGTGELWKRRHERAELEARIAGIHEPYHRCLGATLAQLRDRWGAALLLDLHSMPTLTVRAGTEPPEFVLGDRFGASCDGSLVAAAFTFFSQHQRRAAHNRPYAGGYVLERHADPAHGLHALQLEIDRASYLDPRLAEQGAGFEPMVRALTVLVERLSQAVCTLSSGDECWAEAAE